ncbi:MAG: GNAT family N-acetyltransferase [Rhodospirillaceae bacterium]|nr:GNAT family N-acetyltransferase [Rhodospirillaceae bacterium]
MFGRRKILAKGDKVYLFEPALAFADEFLTMTKASQNFHQPWVFPAMEQRRFRGYLDRLAEGRAYGFFIGRAEDDAFLGVINVNDPIFGGFRSASLGYYIHADHARCGYMSEALALVLDYAFTTLQLHRLEANVQPQNEASLALVQRLGFRKEGFSPAFLQIDGVWRDHERWAMLAEDWLGASGLSTRQIRKQFGVVV